MAALPDLSLAAYARLGFRYGFFHPNPRHPLPIYMNIKKQIETARRWYARACEYDRSGLEKKAEPCYSKVYELGWRLLPVKERPGFFLGFGSTLRNNRKFKRSAEILAEGVKHFPHYPALKVFLALTLHSSGKFKKAAGVLFLSCLDMPGSSFDGYERAIRFYIARLKNVPR